MSEPLDQYFAELLKKFEYKDGDLSSLEHRHHEIVTTIRSKFLVQDSFVAGSYPAHTMIALQDQSWIDIFIVLDRSHYAEKNQEYLLEEFKKILQHAYPSHIVNRYRGKKATITFPDISLAVFPCFEREGGGYILGDARREIWMPTDPKNWIEILKSADQDHDGTLSQFMRVIKIWNQYYASVLDSTHLESFILDLFRSSCIPGYSEALQHFFHAISERMTDPVPDPVGYDNNLNGYLHPLVVSMETEVVAFSKTYADTAISHIKSGNTTAAIGEYERLFSKFSEEKFTPGRMQKGPLKVLQVGKTQVKDLDISKIFNIILEPRDPKKPIPLDKLTRDKKKTKR